MVVRSGNKRKKKRLRKWIAQINDDGVSWTEDYDSFNSVYKA